MKILPFIVAISCFICVWAFGAVMNTYDDVDINVVSGRQGIPIVLAVVAEKVKADGYWGLTRFDTKDEFFISATSGARIPVAIRINKDGFTQEKMCLPKGRDACRVLIRLPVPIAGEFDVAISANGEVIRQRVKFIPTKKFAFPLLMATMTI